MEQYDRSMDPGETKIYRQVSFLQIATLETTPTILLYFE
jgi:hypothetical protein